MAHPSGERRMPRWFLVVTVPLMAVTAYFYVEVARKHTDTSRAISMVKNFAIDPEGHPNLEETIGELFPESAPYLWRARRISRLYDTYEVRCILGGGRGGYPCVGSGARQPPLSPEERGGGGSDRTDAGLGAQGGGSAFVMETRGSSESRRFRVVITGLTAEKNRYAVTKTIATHLNLPFFEAREIVEKTPSEIVSGIPEEAADLLEDRLRQAGAVIEVLPDDVEGVNYCEIHPNIEARGTCGLCGRYICAPCILQAGKERICVDCLAAERRLRRLRRIRQVTIAFLGLLTLLYAANILFNRVEYLAGRYTLRILIVELTPSWEEAFQERIATLNAPEGSDYALSGIDDWFQKEFLRFNPTRTHFSFLKVERAGPFLVESEPPAVGADSGFLSRFLERRRLVRYLEGVARAHDLDLQKYDMKIFLYFHDRLTPLRPGRVKEASLDNIDLVYYPIHTTTPAHYVMEVVQEIGRQLGASTKYRITGGRVSIYPFGFVSPFQKPLYPQRHAELMSGTIPVKQGVEENIDSLDQLRVGHATAHEFGWISKADYKRYYHLP